MQRIYYGVRLRLMGPAPGREYWLDEHQWILKVTKSKIERPQIGGCVFVDVVVVVVTDFLRAPCFKTGYTGASAGFAGIKLITLTFLDNYAN